MAIERTIGISIHAADVPSADDLMMRNYAAMAQKERELATERAPPRLLWEVRSH